MSQTADELGDLDLYDGEVHTGESWSDLVEYIEDDEARQNEKDGYAFGPDEFGPITWDGWDRTAGGRIDWDHFSLDSAETFADKRERFGIDKVVFSPGPAFRISLVPDTETRIRCMRAYNNLVTDRYARDDDTNYAKLIALGEHPEESAEEIRKHGDEDGIVGVFITDVGPTYPMGHRSYYPLYEALEAQDLPIVLHSTSGMNAGFPAAGIQAKNFLEWHTMSHPVAKMWHATSIITRGIPEKFDVTFGFWEAGFSWIQLIAHRMDREYLERPNEAPDLTKLPSEYLSEFYYGTQPIEEPRDEGDLQTIIDMNDLEDQLVFTSDVPHMDFDAPMAVLEHEGLNEETKRKMIHDNPKRMFGI